MHTSASVKRQAMPIQRNTRPHFGVSKMEFFGKPLVQWPTMPPVKCLTGVLSDLVGYTRLNTVREC